MARKRTQITGTGTGTTKTPKTRDYVIIERIPGTVSEDGQSATGPIDRPVALLTTTSAAAALKHFVTPRYSVRTPSTADIYACAEAKIRPVVAAVTEDSSDAD